MGDSPAMIWFKSICQLVPGLVLVCIFSDPMCDVLSGLTNQANEWMAGVYISQDQAEVLPPPYNASASARYYTLGDAKGQYIPISPFYISFIITPLCSNASELISSLMLAMKKKKKNISMVYAQLYGAGAMNNTLCMAVFAALVYLKNLRWEFTSEVTVILITELMVGAVGYKLETIKLWHGIPVA